jgi:hypothetical protein
MYLIFSQKTEPATLNKNKKAGANTPAFENDY